MRQVNMFAANHWWLKLTCFAFFSGLACFVPLLTTHLHWLGLNLKEIGIIQLIAGCLSCFGIALASGCGTRCGHRSSLAASLLIAAFCGAGLVLLPRISDRIVDDRLTERPVAEILCRPEGSALFFRKCSDTCELDAVTRTELVVSDCQFEPQSRLPVNFIDSINRLTMEHMRPSGGRLVPLLDEDEDGDSSEPERGDLPQKVSPTPPLSNQTDEGSGSTPSLAYDYDYEANHPREKRQMLSHHLDSFEIAEKADLPYTSSPHICYSSYSSSTTTCHVFTGNNHLFRFNTSFYTGITNNGQCFYALNYDNVDNHILSELRCRSNKPNHQVRCRAEGVRLRMSITRNGTSMCHIEPPESNQPLIFWLYILFRTCAEIAVISSVILLRIVTLNQERNVRWWIWGLVGCGFGPLSGWVADCSGFGISFLLGSTLFGLSALGIAFSPSPPPPHPVLAATLATVEDEIQIIQTLLPVHRIVGRDLRLVLTDKVALLILFYLLFMGMVNSTIMAPFYWYLMELGEPNLTLGIAIPAQWLVLTSVVILSARWLWKRCGHRYIFIIGLLVYSIRFLGYTMAQHHLVLLAIEMLEPLCSLWMLLTASLHIGQLQCRYIPDDRRWSVDAASQPRSVKVNVWALIIIFHYSFGRGLGGLITSMSTYYFGMMSFTAVALISLFLAACWFLWIHLGPSTSCRKKPISPVK